ncbi:hypothetical protein NBO_6g0114 [Nosema bombycis CQ1]|uniref:Uncharacterized protein n=1 Tax=Nosema bombycis (strain CQ1 / CVCC 102059) TaxID=578461 RepID=R0MBP5_NOSB1|nr:hypothetical protein NBO_6g0114 [Nosema bombycis CQ1]|eukprot:EOB15364.1 hypothetical protein NBO_6g0114 [Nosema bombycis CQ1]
MKAKSCRIFKNPTLRYLYYSSILYFIFCHCFFGLVRTSTNTNCPSSNEIINNPCHQTPSKIMNPDVLSENNDKVSSKTEQTLIIFPSRDFKHNGNNIYAILVCICILFSTICAVLAFSYDVGFLSLSLFGSIIGVILVLKVI